MSPNRTATRSVVALAIVLSPGLLVAVAGECDAPIDRGWHRGPVRYLLSPEDTAAFGRLDDREEREAFVEAFWRKIDPDPRTTENEVRDRFLDRCREAQRRFETVRQPGWETDRGKTLILFGSPDAIRRDAGDALGRDREIWTYRSRSGRAGAPFEVVFRRDGAGDFVLTFDPKAGKEDPLSPTEEPETRRRFFMANPIDVDYETYIAMLKAQPEDPATIQARGPDFVARPEGEPDAFPRPRGEAVGVTFEDRIYRFRADDGSVVALIVLVVVAPGTERAPEAAVWLRARDGSGRDGPAWRFALEPRSELSGPSRTGYSTKVYLGSRAAYDVRFGALQPDGGAVWVRDRVFEPGSSSETLAVSSIVTAESFGPADGGNDDPFAIGSERVLPRPDATFRRDLEPLRLYFQVYGAGAAPDTGRPRVDVRFRFWRETDRGPRRHGRTVRIREADGTSMGLSLPVDAWPTGDYRVSVELRDRVTRERIGASTTFRLVDGPSRH